MGRISRVILDGDMGAGTRIGVRSAMGSCVREVS